MPAAVVDLDALGRQYREAKAAVPAHLVTQAAAEMAHAAWLKAHRGVPSHVFYDRETGEPLDPELVQLEAAMRQAERDVRWCQAVVLACGELVKGEPLDVVFARNEAHRGDLNKTRDRAMSLLAGATDDDEVHE